MPPQEIEKMRDFQAIEFKEFGEFYWLDDGALIGCEINTFDALGRDINEAERQLAGGEITAPQSQEFLDSINEVFGTSFKFEEFAGR